MYRQDGLRIKHPNFFFQKSGKNEPPYCFTSRRLPVFSFLLFVNTHVIFHLNRIKRLFLGKYFYFTNGFLFTDPSNSCSFLNLSSLILRGTGFRDKKSSGVVCIRFARNLMKQTPIFPYFGARDGPDGITMLFAHVTLDLSGLSRCQNYR
jgi:hypothetical protein